MLSVTDEVVARETYSIWLDSQVRFVSALPFIMVRVLFAVTLTFNSACRVHDRQHIAHVIGKESGYDVSA